MTSAQVAITKLRPIIDGYGVRVRTGTPSARRRWVSQRAGRSSGPSGHAIDLVSRTVFIDSTEPEPSDFGHPATVLHELMHLVCHPPWLPLDFLPEGVFLLGFERASAQQLFGDTTDFHEVVAFQRETDMWGDGERVDGYTDQYVDEWFATSLKFQQSLGWYPDVYEPRDWEHARPAVDRWVAAVMGYPVSMIRAMVPR